MSRLVMKFGGTSVANLECIQRVAKIIKNELESNPEIIVVVSAMAGATNDLTKKIESTSQLYDAREYAAVVSSGENVSAGLLALNLQNLGINARVTNFNFKRTF